MVCDNYETIDEDFLLVSCICRTRRRLSSDVLTVVQDFCVWHASIHPPRVYKTSDNCQATMKKRVDEGAKSERVEQGARKGEMNCIFRSIDLNQLDRHVEGRTIR